MVVICDDKTYNVIDMGTPQVKLKLSQKLARLDKEAGAELNGVADTWSAANRRAGAPPPKEISQATKSAVNAAEAEAAWREKLQSGGENKG